MNSICLSTDSLPVLGLDVAKKSVQAELRTAGGKTVRFGFENNAKGFAQLARILKEHNVPKVWAGLEATGPYSHALALWLHGAGHRVSLLNPRRVKQYARSAGNRNKTDLMDAAIIADFVCALKPATWQPPMLEVAQLQALVRRREELSLMLQAEKNRLEGVASQCALLSRAHDRYPERGEGTLGKAHYSADPISPATLLRSSTALHHQRNRLAQGRYPLG
jgi:transposase